ncbi:MGMT family protein [Nocardioides insulae]|uniref:MGMT family protein n=1 Tax=Nocardioides insulae TaxID=394734 RepID=UPI000413EA0A|nr:MGMT family protein [Nocardioides insulae]
MDDGYGDAVDTQAYVEAVLALVEQVPRGRVTTYGALADALFDEYGGGPRQVAAVMSGHGGPVPWWRVVRADGSLPASHHDSARQAYLEEGTPLSGPGRVDLRAALWLPALSRAHREPSRRTAR